MSFFTKIGKKKTGTGFRMQPVEQEVLDGVLQFVQHLKLPKENRPVRIQLSETWEEGRAGAPYYLFLFAEGQEDGCLNAGYMAGQTASFLRFYGIESRIMRQASAQAGQIREQASAQAGQIREQASAQAGQIREQASAQTGRTSRCVAALAFGRTDSLRSRKRRDRAEESLCICRESADWSKELLAFAKESFPSSARAVKQVATQEWIHFMARSLTHKHPEEYAFEAGIAISNVMTSAEKLWIDLEFVCLEREMCTMEESEDRLHLLHSRRKQSHESPYLVSVCRKQAWEESAVQLQKGTERPDTEVQTPVYQQGASGTVRYA